MIKSLICDFNGEVMGLFGTAGARGITNRDITPQLTFQIAAAFGLILKRTRGRYAVGHDTRPGAAMLARSAAAGLASVGCDVMEMGCVTTGVFSLNIVEHGWNGGVLITGSHMPPERIGVIPVMDDGAYAPPEITDRMERLVVQDLPRVEPARIGRIIPCKDPVPFYIRTVLTMASAPAIRRRRFHVLIDPANGTACAVSKDLMRGLGCRVTMLHGDERPIPQRPSEPRAHTVRRASAAVRRLGCDLGVCLDVDADRVLFIDEHGTPLSEDRMGALLAMRTLNPGDSCVTPINSSGLIEETCESRGARLAYCRIGQPATVAAIKRRRARFAYEESGKYYFPRHYVFADGLIAAVQLLSIMANERTSLSRLMSGIPVYAQVKHTVAIRNGTAAKIMDRVRRLWRHHATDRKARDVVLDGLKRVYSDHSWLLIRKSGTEPLIRVYADAPAQSRAEELVRSGESLVRRAMRGRR